MGNTRTARVRIDGRTYAGEALLETAELIFRGEKRIVIPFAKIETIDAADGRLTINGNVTFELGEDAAKWAEKIRNPKSVIQKLGVKAGQSVALVHLDDAAFAADLEKAGALVTVGKPKKNSDAVFYGASSREELARLGTLRRRSRRTARSG